MVARNGEEDPDRPRALPAAEAGTAAEATEATGTTGALPSVSGIPGTVPPSLAAERTRPTGASDPGDGGSGASDPNLESRVVRDLALILAGAILLIGLTPFIGPVNEPGLRFDQGAVAPTQGVLPLFWFLVLGLGVMAVRRWDDLRRQSGRTETVQRALHSTHARWRAYVEHAPDTIMTLDPKGRILYLNRPVPGYSADEVVGTTVTDYVVPEERAEVRQQLSRVFERDASTEFGMRVIRGDGEALYYEGHVAPVAEPGQDLPGSAVLIARDVTDTRRAETALRRNSETLEQRNRELKAFAFACAHDLQETLHDVTRSVQHIERTAGGGGDGDGPDEATAEYMEMAREGVERTHRLLNDLLTYAEVGTGPPPDRPADADAAMDEALAALSGRIRETGGEVTRDPLPDVVADPRELRILLRNLLDNGLKFHPEGKPPRVHVSAEVGDDEWVLSVRDEGIGIRPGYESQVFEPFRRLHPRGSYPGSGTGLAICKKIVDRHGGRLWYESVHGEGTTVRVALPADGRTVPA